MNRVNSSTALAYQNSINARPASTLNNSKQLTAKDNRRGSFTRGNFIETPTDSKKAMQFFSKIGLPSLYKLDKLQYSRGEVADIGLKLSKKLEESESLLDYERRKSDELRNQKLELQQRVQELLYSTKESGGDHYKAKIKKMDKVAVGLQECLDALKDSMIHNFMFIDFYKEVREYVSTNSFEN